MKQKPFKLHNSLNEGHIFYGLHMVEGIAEYRPPGEEMFRVFTGENVIKLMNSTFPGKPVYVGHVDERTSLSNADGVVIDSFYNKHDGKHWCKFVVTTQKGLDHIRKGWRLSNTFRVEKHKSGGLWHGVDYDKEVLAGTYDHLAIVPDPRYDESVIFTPEEFKKYNNEKEAELIMLANSKEKPMKFQLFKKTKIENSKEVDYENMTVVLPKSKKEFTLTQLVNEMDEVASKPAAGTIEDTMVTVDGEEMTVKKLISLFVALKDATKADEVEDEKLNNAEDDEDDDKLDNSLGEDDDEDEDDSDSDDEDEEEEAPKTKVSNSSDKKAKEAAAALKAKQVAKAKALKLKNAGDNYHEEKPRVADMSMDQVARGAQRYGSAKK